MDKLKVASFFCGCGGTDVGLLGDFFYQGKYYSTNKMEIVYFLEKYVIFCCHKRNFNAKYSLRLIIL